MVRGELGVTDLGAIVAVVIPMHNAEQTIEATLTSIAHQTVKPSRVLVVDDVSTDRSRAIVAEITDPTVEVIVLTENLGAGGARNAGVAAATTGWIAFLDADDLWEPTFLEETLGAAVSMDADFASSGEIRVSRSGVRSERLLDGPADARDLTEKFWRTALRFMPAHPSATVIRKSALDAIGGFPTNIRTGEDWLLWARLWLRGRFVLVNKPLAQWIQIEGGLTTHGKPYRQEWVVNKALAGVLVQAIRRRRSGSGWFAIWLIRTVIRQQFVWLRKRLGRRSAARRTA
jgi:cellulose synthase/poly-beta-1,6-N-acetylglucosamine synthase-like glycosyltransferase